MVHEHAAGAGARLTGEPPKLERTTMSAAASRSASASTTIGFLPPSSSWTRRPSPIAAWILRPVAFEPVNVTAPTRSSATRWAPAATPCTTFSTPAGSPASSNAAASRSPISGVIGDGLNTTVLPAASAGPILRLAMLSGKFHGVMTPTTPTGSSTEYTSGVSSLGNVVPVSRYASPA